MNGIEMSFDLPTAKEFVDLRVLAGMTARSVEGARQGLPHSNCMVTLRKDKLLIGMGRIIGDGATTFQIADIVVHPDHQGKGLGKTIMTELMKWLEENASPQSYVSLLADGDAKFLYEAFGFVESAPYTVGMQQFLE